VRRALVLLVAFALSVVPASGDEPDLHFPILGDGTQEGDWTTYLVKTSFDPAAEGLEGALPGRIVVTFRVTDTDEHGFTLKTITDPWHARDWETRRIPRHSKNVTDLLGIDGSEKISFASRPKRERVTIGERTFDCVRLAFKTESGELVQEGTLLASDEWNGPRLVRLELHGVSGPQPWVKLEMELRGFGTEEKLLWGSEPKDVK